MVNRYTPDLKMLHDDCIRVLRENLSALSDPLKATRESTDQIRMIADIFLDIQKLMPKDDKQGAYYPAYDPVMDEA